MGQELTARTNNRGLVSCRLIPDPSKGRTPAPGTPVTRDGCRGGDHAIWAGSDRPRGWPMLSIALKVRPATLSADARLDAVALKPRARRRITLRIVECHAGRGLGGP